MSKNNEAQALLVPEKRSHVGSNKKRMNTSTDPTHLEPSLMQIRPSSAQTRASEQTWPRADI